jgi:CRP-like cAMP-binding protein
LTTLLCLGGIAWKKVYIRQTFLVKVGTGRTYLTSPKNHTIFSQGDVANAVFFIQAGKVKLSVVPRQGKEAVLRYWRPARSLENPVSLDN